MVDIDFAREIINKIQKLRRMSVREEIFILTTHKPWKGCVSDAIGWTPTVRPGGCSLWQ